MSSESEKEEPGKNNNEPISLSAALLAPINSIFETQIHAARAFLNFILQMGFRHTPSQEELDEASEEEKEQEEKRTEERKADKARIRELLKKRKTKSLSESEVNELRALDSRSGDLYQQMINYVDNTGNQFAINIPNLALLPIKPLVINEADFSYEFEVSTENDKYRQMSTVYKTAGEEKERPWFLIREPKSIRGHYAPRKGKKEDSGDEENEGHEASIKINVKVGNSEMPYGLEKLLTHLTDSMDNIDTEEDEAQNNTENKS